MSRTEANLAKLEEMTHYIIDKCGAKSTFGKKVLFKILYFSDFNHYKINFSAISSEEYQKIEHGPAPRHFGFVLNELVSAGKVEYFESAKPKESWVFKSKSPPKLKLLTKPEIATIDRVIEKIGHMNGAEIERLSHQDNPYKATKLNEIMNYGLVFYRQEEIERLVE